jgi:hypothetical protein
VMIVAQTPSTGPSGGVDVWGNLNTGLRTAFSPRSVCQRVSRNGAREMGRRSSSHPAGPLQARGSSPSIASSRRTARTSTAISTEL